jgi:3-keto-5-aminohexanoate cleavage enzyme
MNFTIHKALAQDKNDILEVLKPWNMHRIPSPEAEDIDFSCFFVAKMSNKIVGVAGFKILGKGKAETRLLAVLPDLQGTGIGKALQETRLEAMYELGIQTVLTEADRDEIIIWYKKHCGYKEIGKRAKLSNHGLSTKSFFVALELDLNQYMRNKTKKSESISHYIASHDPHPLSPYMPLIINVALTGMIPTKISTPFVPISVDEIIEDAINVCDAGASIVHLHARDQEGKPSSDARYYEQIIAGIKSERPHLICCVTTSGRDGISFEQRSEVLHLTGKAKPDMASLTLGSLNFLSGASINSLDTIQNLAMLMKEKNIKPELEIFDSGMINVAKYLERHNIISGSKYFNILLGNLNTASATISDLAHIYTSLPENSVWATAGLGSFQLPMNMASIIAGGHVRVGIEDNIYYDSNKNNFASNKSLVDRVVKIAHELERPIATPSYTRNILNLDL